MIREMAGSYHVYIYLLSYMSKNQSLIVQQESQGQRNLLVSVHSYIFLT